MTSKLVTLALEREGLSSILSSRERGQVDGTPDALEILARSDMLALGAAADIARRRECGDEAHIYVPSPPVETTSLVVVGARETLRGTALLRKIATLRLAGAMGRRIVVDWGALGLEIGQIALCFGATDLAGPIASRRGLPMLEAEDQKKLVKRREIAGYVERAGFRPVFVPTDAPAPRQPGDPSSVSEFGTSSASRAHVES
jgi:hypothetical protein